MATKEFIEASMRKALKDVTNLTEKNTPPLKDPEMNAEKKIVITDDFTVGLTEYKKLANAPSMCIRAKRIMHNMWPPEIRHRLLATADPKKPDKQIVTEAEKTKIIEVTLALQQFKRIPIYSEKDRIINNIGEWVCQWLKSK
ncbi:uncharacterized protein LOC130665420 [Microplitis mediator]|uniref:uncharacterized protein LOC130665420 n=1 Tax=Microplitis mediator TaxID=375433 RepID=UPI002555EFF0|nr:uncharacterized protein LOC130665420 [Microplitis mediator]